jgi:hypothetical protein
VFLLHFVADQSDLLEVYGFPSLKCGIDVIEDLVVSNNQIPQAESMIISIAKGN